jgi:hypothetical protein
MIYEKRGTWYVKEEGKDIVGFPSKLDAESHFKGYQQKAPESLSAKTWLKDKEEVEDDSADI